MASDPCTPWRRRQSTARTPRRAPPAPGGLRPAPLRPAVAPSRPVAADGRRARAGKRPSSFHRQRAMAQIAGELLIKRARCTRLGLQQLAVVVGDVVGVRGHLLGLHNRIERLAVIHAGQQLHGAGAAQQTSGPLHAGRRPCAAGLHRSRGRTDPGQHNRSSRRTHSPPHPADPPTTANRHTSAHLLSPTPTRLQRQVQSLVEARDRCPSLAQRLWEPQRQQTPRSTGPGPPPVW